jgi:hypothetical protein
MGPTRLAIFRDCVNATSIRGSTDILMTLIAMFVILDVSFLSVMVVRASFNNSLPSATWLLLQIMIVSHRTLPSPIGTLANAHCCRQHRRPSIPPLSINRTAVYCTATDKNLTAAHLPLSNQTACQGACGLAAAGREGGGHGSGGRGGGRLKK